MLRSAAIGCFVFMMAPVSAARAEPSQGHVMGVPAPTPPEPEPTATEPTATEPAATERLTRPANEPEPAQRSWYGWQTLTIDGVAAALLFASIASTDASNNDATGGMLVIAGGTYLLGTPIVHAMNGRAGIGAASLGIRIGLPIIGLLAFGTDSQSLEGAAAGFILGMGTAVAIDAAVFARKRPPGADLPHAPPARSSDPAGAGGTTTRLAPSLMPTRGGALAGMIGVF